ncbi:MAG: hypothetical protein NVSMB2_27120 [Chloroflexota bacterium]
MSRWVCAVLIASLLTLSSSTPVTRTWAEPTPQVDTRSADWLRAVRDTALWSGPIDPSVQFTSLPLGSFVQPRAGSDSGRLLVYFPGDGGTRQAGMAWVPAQDLAPSGPPPWMAVSELDGNDARLVPEPRPTRSMPIMPPPVTATEVAVVDDATGLMLYGRSAHAREAPASTTKITTALVVLQKSDSLDTPVSISVDGWAMAAADGSSVMGLVPGQKLTLRTLLYGLLLPSGNDAAEQLARSVGSSRDEFVNSMNAMATDELHLADTHFVNPSGLDAPNHFSSAYDLAQVARRAMRENVFRDIVATPRTRQEGLMLAGHNPLIGAYPGADGVKTGTTDAAGKALVGSATRNDHRVYAVVLHSEDTLADTTALLDWAWASFTWPHNN